MNIMQYRGYVARIEYSNEDDCFIGHIAGINDIVGFHADSVFELYKAFEEAVDDYLETCKKAGRPPQKSYSGNIMLRVPPEIHARVAMMAEAHGIFSAQICGFLLVPSSSLFPVISLTGNKMVW